MSKDPLGWNYPAGAEDDPNAPWNQDWSQDDEQPEEIYETEMPDDED